MKKSTEWFKDWFDSPYYHILYKHRDETEAKFFIDNLIEYLHPNPANKFLDIGCGKGRHSIYLNSKNFDVTGVDLSPESIKTANEHANEKLHFAVHDMREIFQPNTYDYVVNLFTSFGFFDTKEAHRDTILAMSKNLKSGGKLIIDFMNPEVIINKLVSEEQKTIDNITFYIKRYFKDGIIFKEITFKDNGREFWFQEKVKALTQNDFKLFFEHARLTVNATFGDYHLNSFDANSSKRMIFITTYDF